MEKIIKNFPDNDISIVINGMYCISKVDGFIYVIIVKINSVYTIFRRINNGYDHYMSDDSNMVVNHIKEYFSTYS